MRPVVCLAFLTAAGFVAGPASARPAQDEKRQLAEALKDRDAARTERDAARTERDAARGERDAARVEKDAAVKARDEAGTERDAARKERDAAVKQRAADSAAARADADKQLADAAAKLDALKAETKFQLLEASTKLQLLDASYKLKVQEAEAKLLLLDASYKLQLQEAKFKLKECADKLKRVGTGGAVKALSPGSWARVEGVNHSRLTLRPDLTFDYTLSNLQTGSRLQFWGTFRGFGDDHVLWTFTSYELVHPAGLSAAVDPKPLLDASWSSGVAVDAGTVTLKNSDPAVKSLAPYLEGRYTN